MPGQFLRGLHGHTAVYQGGNVRMPQAVEIESLAGSIHDGEKIGFPPALRFVRIGRCSFQPRLPGGSHIAMQHACRVVGEVREHGNAGRFVRDPVAEHNGEVRPQGLLIPPAAFGIGGFHHNKRRCSLKVERCWREASQLPRPQTGMNGEAIEHRAIDARHGMFRPGAALRGRDQPGQFIVAKCPADQAAVGLSVE